MVRKSLNISDSSEVTIASVGVDRYRINVYDKSFIEGSVVPRTTLSSSYFVEIKEEVLTDLTIRA